MEQPKMPMLTLDLQKTTTYNTVPLRLTQGDKGYIQPFTLTNAFQQYTVTADVLGFRAMKPDGKYIEIQNEPARFALADGVWEFNLPDELTQAIGTVTGAYFYVQSGTNIVASTTKFNYSISAAWSSDEQSNNYVTAFEELEQKLRDTVSVGATTVNGLNNYSNEAKATLTKSLNDFTASVNTWKTNTTTAVDKVLAEEKTALQKAQSDWNAEYNKVVAYYQSMQTEWLAKKASYDKLAADEIAKMEADKKTVIDKFASDSTAKLTAVTNSLADLETKKTTALDKVAKDATAKIADIQSQADTKLASIQEDWNVLKTSLNAEIQALADKVVATDGKADEIKTRLDELAAQLDSIDIVSVKAVADKATADVATLTASLAVKADKTEVESVKQKVDGLQVGGRNLFTETSDKSSIITGDNWNPAVIGVYKTPKVSQEYTVSVEVPEADHDVLLEVYRWNNTGARVGIALSTVHIKSGEKAHVTFTWPDPGDSDATQIAVNLAWTNGTDTGTYSYCKAKLEVGNISTDWTPAPEDVQIQLTNIVSKLTKSVNGVTPDASGNISLPQPDLSPYVTNSALTLKLASYYDKTTADGRYLPKTTSFATPAQVTTAETNAKSYADTKKTEAQSYTDTKLSGVLKSWTGTQAQYDALATKDQNVLYIIKEG